jgi:hypothetical protein
LLAREWTSLPLFCHGCAAGVRVDFSAPVSSATPSRLFLLWCSRPVGFILHLAPFLVHSACGRRSTGRSIRYNLLNSGIGVSLRSAALARRSGNALA